ncbi:hypothetical protein PMAYCL1PPCAC_07549, partial [Pristionchus mayeri]
EMSTNHVNWTTDVLTAEMIPIDVALFVLLGYVVYLLLILIGIPANVFVLQRMLHFRRKCPDTYRAGTGACLLAMSVADLVALISILFFCIMSFGLELPFSAFVYRWVCKISIFSMHTATSVAIWSWLLMSILRWLALYRPLMYHTLFNLPVRAVALITLAASLTNVWLLFTVDFNFDSNTCMQHWLFESEAISKFLLLAEMIWSFFLPILVVAYLDLSTLLSIPRLISARYQNSLLHNEAHAQQQHLKKSSTKTLLRWLAIALIDILLNAPENIRRLITILGFVTDEFAVSYEMTILRTVSDIFYYSQYSFNAAYLALFIYDRATSSGSTRRENHSSCTHIVNHSATVGLFPPRPTVSSSTDQPSLRVHGRIAKSRSSHFLVPDTRTRRAHEV